MTRIDRPTPRIDDIWETGHFVLFVVLPGVGLAWLLFAAALRW